MAERVYIDLSWTETVEYGVTLQLEVPEGSIAEEVRKAIVAGDIDWHNEVYRQIQDYKNECDQKVEARVLLDVAIKK